MITQVESGKAWEYGLASTLANMLNDHCVLKMSKARLTASIAYNTLTEAARLRITRATREAVMFLREHDTRLLNATCVDMQPDQKGVKGDVRDVLIHTDNEVIGISAKHRHNALKHSRIAHTLDFGKSWYGTPCSDKYWNAVAPVFNLLRESDEENFRDLKYKDDILYVPLLRAVIEETTAHANPAKLLRYLVGAHDFYKVIKDNGNVVMQ